MILWCRLEARDFTIPNAAFLIFWVPGLNVHIQTKRFRTARVLPDKKNL